MCTRCITYCIPQQNLLALQAHLEMIQGVERSKSSIEPLLAADDYSGALDVLDAAKRTLSSELSELNCLKSAARQMTEYESLAYTMLASRFLSMAQQSHDQHNSSTTAHDSGADSDNDDSYSYSASTSQQQQHQHISSKQQQQQQQQQHARSIHSSTAYDTAKSTSDSTTANDDTALQPILEGLQRLNKLQDVLDMYQQHLLEELKLIIRTVVGDYLNTTGAAGELIDTFTLPDDDEFDTNTSNGSSSSSGAYSDPSQGTVGVTKLKTLEHSAFTDCLSLCFEHVLSAIERAVQVYQYVVKWQQQCSSSSTTFSQSLTASSNSSSSNGSSSSNSNSSSVNSSAVESTVGVQGAASLRALAQLVERSVSQLLSVRRDYHATSITPQQLRELCDVSIGFATQVNLVYKHPTCSYLYEFIHIHLSRYLCYAFRSSLYVCSGRLQ
jgi:hypothetical protein